VHTFASASQEAAFIAAQLRSAHLLNGQSWESMGVLVRTGSAISLIRRALTSAGVPVEVRREDIPLVEQPPVRALLTSLDAVIGERELDAELADDLITSPIGGADALAARRLRQELRWRELASGGGRASGELLAVALTEPTMLDDIDDSVAGPGRQVSSLIAAGRRVAAEESASAEDVLWAMWSAAGLQELWTATALGGGPGAAVADRNLDSVVALFDSVARYVDRMPGAGPATFLEYLRDQQIPSDTMHPSTPHTQGVSVLTAHAAKGLEWDIVAVAGVQEGVWPDMRERGGLLGTEELLELVADRDDSAVVRANARLAEERRLFYVAITRARKRLFVTAVSAEDNQPSRFLDELDPTSPDAPERDVERPTRSIDLQSLVAELRRVVCDVSEPDVRRRGAAMQLARLADEHVAGAYPAGWYGYRALSVDDALGEPGEPVRISPSKVEEFHRCELRWLLKACGASDTGRLRASIGTLVHDLAEKAAVDDWTEERMLAELDQVWPTIDTGTGWSAAREYDRAREMVRRLAQWVRANPRQFVGAEVSFDVTIERARLVGRVDRLDADGDGRLVVIDFKTGKSAPTKEQIKAHPQLATYQLAVDLGGFDRTAGPGRASGGASLVQLGKGNAGASEQFQAPLNEADDPQWAREFVEETARGMTQATFKAVPGTWCRTCPALPSCPAQPEGEQVTP
jgi:ATP-dependent exoDNAse (exonuclease V) beta subunit